MDGRDGGLFSTYWEGFGDCQELVEINFLGGGGLNII